jgi:hypothetical protein
MLTAAATPYRQLIDDENLSKQRKCSPSLEVLTFLCVQQSLSAAPLLFLETDWRAGLCSRRSPLDVGAVHPLSETSTSHLESSRVRWQNCETNTTIEFEPWTFSKYSYSGELWFGALGTDFRKGHSSLFLPVCPGRGCGPHSLLSNACRG